MSDITFLDKEQITGNNKLGIFAQYGTKCSVTDFSILLGVPYQWRGYTSEREYGTGTYYTKSIDRSNEPFGRVPFRVYSVDEEGLCQSIHSKSPNFRNCGVRPALPYSVIKPTCSNPHKGETGVVEVQWGEYPQKVVKNSLADVLNALYLSKSLTKTGKKYTIDSRHPIDDRQPFFPKELEEYEYMGEKYVRYVNSRHMIGTYYLSEGREIEDFKTYWLLVEPIVWLVDEKANIAVTKKILFAGVPFQNKGDYQSFDKTDIKQFLDNYFAKEIVGDKKMKEVLGEPKIIRKQNPYNFAFEDMSEEEIIRGAIESNIPVFLHGRSSDGKSARVKQIDPDCEIIYLRNATPDSLNGKSVYNAEKGEMIDVPPSWYKKIKAKCEESPDKLHILFFDEITNALPSIQGMAFNIILDKEVNGIMKLPDNCRIVAAGNDLNDSLAANEMAESLFNRFAHVYIDTTVDKWLRWASKSENHIHPSIYAYIAYKSYTGCDVLRTEYNGEKPNADPRKWEMASKVLWSVGKPSMLRALIGEELTNDFIAFCKQQVITVEDVVSSNYSSSDLEMNLDEKFATAVGLSSCEEKDIKVVREFVGKLGAEIQATFDVLWAHGEEDRIEQIAKLKMESSSRRN